METTTVIMLSGGIESTACLYKTLVNTNNKVVVHHIDLLCGISKRPYIEKQACKKIVDWVRKNVRDVEYTESTFSFNYDKFMGWDYITSMYIGALVAKNYFTKDNEVELCCGYSRTDNETLSPWRISNANIISLICSLSDPTCKKQYIPKIIQPVIDLTKKEIIKFMPKELFDMTWSCRLPLYEIISDNEKKYYSCDECGVCKYLLSINRYERKSIIIKDE